MPEFEIGVVYQKGSQLFVAVDASALISLKSGSPVMVRPTTQYKLIRNATVEDLCENWGVELDAFDNLMRSYLGPPAEAAKPRPRGTRRQTTDEDDYWRRHRTGRIAQIKP